MTAFPVVTRKIRGGSRPLWMEIRPNAGAATALFLPGTMLSPWQYRPLLNALRASGLAVAAPHLTGHGRNPHWRLFTFGDLLRDVQDAAAWLRRTIGGPMVVCGHSQGGILALAHAATPHAPDAAFLLTAALPQAEEAVRLTRFTRLAHRRPALEHAIAVAARWAPWLPVPASAYLSLRRIVSGADGVCFDRRGARLTYPLRFLHSLFTFRASPRLRCPVWLLGARDDALFTPEILQKTFARLSAPAKTLAWLPRGGHLAAMQPRHCPRIAWHIASACAGLGLPLRISARSAENRKGV